MGTYLSILWYSLPGKYLQYFCFNLMMVALCFGREFFCVWAKSKISRPTQRCFRRWFDCLWEWPWALGDKQARISLGRGGREASYFLHGGPRVCREGAMNWESYCPSGWGLLKPVELCEVKLLRLLANEDLLLRDQLIGSHSQSHVYATQLDLGNSRATGMLSQIQGLIKP